MIGKLNIELEIGQYLRKVKKRLKSSPPAERQEILSNLRQHIYEGLSAKSSGEPNHDDLKAVLAEMDSPEMYGGKFETLSPKHEESAAVRRRHLSILSLVLLLFGIVSPVLIALFNIISENLVFLTRFSDMIAASGFTRTFSFY